MFPFCHNSCWLLGKSFANCENLTNYCTKEQVQKASENFMKRIIALSDAEDDTISLFRVLRYTRFRLQTLQEAYLMNGEGEKCVGAALCY